MRNQSHDSFISVMVFVYPAQMSSSVFYKNASFSGEIGQFR